jgi:para-nitrobenzyl esterase
MSEALTEAVVATTAGRVRGRSRNGVTAFKGIPYAAPPTGSRRLAEPEPPERWDGVRDALDYGPTAPKGSYLPPFDKLLPEPAIPGDDYLNLNVWTPDPSAGGLPVIVWIHGGSFVNGSGAVPTYDGTPFARDGVVLVTINYRLGAEGFMALPGAPDNRGLRDQIAALEWVGQNIAAFGGDPGNVTLAGESAGAMSVGALLASPRAAGLFRRAILQSGAGHHALTAGTAGKIAAAVAERLGVEPTRAGIAAVDPDRLVEAQQAVQQEVRTVQDPAKWGEAATNLMAFEPVIGDDIVPELPFESIAGGAGKGVDLIVGSTTEEMRFFMVPAGTIDLVTDDMLRGSVAAYGLDADAALSAYALDGASAGDTLAAVATDWFFRIPALRLAETAAARGDRAYVYEFAWPSPAYDGRLGAGHAVELGFSFDNLTAAGGGSLQGDAAPQVLADVMHAAWVAFARDGDPGWPAYDDSRRPVMHFDEESSVLDDPRTEERRLWEGKR